VSAARDRLSELVEAASSTHEQITIPKNGAPAAVLVAVDDWESLQERLFWLSQPGIRESLTAADGDLAAGRSYGEDEIRAEFGVPRRTRSAPRALRGAVHRDRPSRSARRPAPDRPSDHRVRLR